MCYADRVADQAHQVAACRAGRRGPAARATRYGVPAVLPLDLILYMIAHLPPFRTGALMRAWPEIRSASPASWNSSTFKQNANLPEWWQQNVSDEHHFHRRVAVHQKIDVAVFAGRCVCRSPFFFGWTC
jgi:hypothetical protein